MGDRDLALDALARAIEEGWRSGWRVGTERNDNLASLRGDPRFQILLAGIEADMEAQLSRVGVLREEGLLQSP